MQEKSTATTKGPGDITGVRTKKTMFSENKSDTPVTPGTWIYADRDIDIGGGNIVVVGHKWTLITEDQKARKAIHQAANQYIQCIVRDSPPPKGS